MAPPRTRVKICGLTRPDDVDAAVAAGADAVGLVFCRASRRHLGLEQARALAARVPAFVSCVALFVDPPAEEVRAVLDAVQPDLLQFHGTETGEFCSRFGRRYIKAIAMSGTDDPASQFAAHPAANGFLLDSHAPGEIGGRGQRFDWQRVPGGQERIILAGGLTPDNVAAAVAAVRPWAVDVSSGVELAPGEKSAARMAAFIHAVRTADARPRSTDSR